jgi:CDP-diacylglycerol--glycerol-3-phosphate 3-phosphatidyltransferase
MHFLNGGVRGDLAGWAVGAAIVALAMGLIVSYARARAEGLMLECKVGIAQRAERIIVLGGPTLFFGAGPNGLLLFWVTALLAIVSAITVVQRIYHVYRVTQALAEERTVREPVPALVDAEEGRRRE